MLLIIKLYTILKSNQLKVHYLQEDHLSGISDIIVILLKEITIFYHLMQNLEIIHEYLQEVECQLKLIKKRNKLIRRSYNKVYFKKIRS